MEVGSVDFVAAVAEHAAYIQALEKAGATIVMLPFVHGAYDSVFAKDSALVVERRGVRRALLARLRRQAIGPVELVACVNNGQHWLMQALLAGGNLHYQAGGMPDRRNLHLFTRASLAALLQECGFSLVAMNTVNAHQPLPAVLEAIRALATATGADPELAVQDALPYQYLVRAIAV